MTAEVEAIEADGRALGFALGCLKAALFDCLRSNGVSLMNLYFGRFSRPQGVGMLCALAAVACGIVYLSAAGAPSRMIVVNLLALLVALAVFPLGSAIVRRLGERGWILAAALAAGLLATALFGAAAEGASRWVQVGPLTLQPSLILLPMLLMLFARAPSPGTTMAVVVAAAALALQPDRAMAGVAVAATATLFAVRAGRATGIALAASSAAFVATILRPDSLPALPFVDGILFSSFEVHPVLGSLLWLAGAALAAPAVAAAVGGRNDAALWAVFGASWLAIFAASALGNYPTPLVGFGGSAIVGYLLSLSFAGGSWATSSVPEPEQESGEALADTFLERRLAAS
jgi:hypothetical protein